jgi:hypothetical protein
MMTSPEPSKIKVVFLVFYYEAWDSLAGVHDLLLSDAPVSYTHLTLPTSP